MGSCTSWGANLLESEPSSMEVSALSEVGQQRRGVVVGKRCPDVHELVLPTAQVTCLTGQMLGVQGHLSHLSHLRKKCEYNFGYFLAFWDLRTAFWSVFR